LQSSGCVAILIPLVFSCRWSIPSAFIALMISGRSSLRVGSPPVIWTLLPGTGLSALRALTMNFICSRVGSYTNPPLSLLA
jgi:hypothetical protein